MPDGALHVRRPDRSLAEGHTRRLLRHDGIARIAGKSPGRQTGRYYADGSTPCQLAFKTVRAGSPPTIGGPSLDPVRRRFDRLDRHRVTVAVRPDELDATLRRD